MSGFSLFPDPNPAPEGLKLLHVADSVPEAEMLSQALIEAGFHVEYVPGGTGGGVFGIAGNNAIYISEAEYDPAAEFLKDYLAAPPQEPTEEGGEESGSGE